MRTSRISPGPPWSSSPVKVASVRTVCDARMKSSADSISILRWLSGRDAVAIRPSGAPVLKKNEPADALTAVANMSVTTVKKHVIRFMTSPDLPERTGMSCGCSLPWSALPRYFSLVLLPCPNAPPQAPFHAVRERVEIVLNEWDGRALLPRVVLESQPQRRPRAGEARFDGAYRAADDVGNLALGQTLEVQKDDHACVIRQRHECCLDLGGDDFMETIELGIVPEPVVLGGHPH